MLHIQFDNELKSYELPAYRAAISTKIGEGNILFHHHLENQSLLYQYPLIQYKNENEKLSIVFIENATEQIHKFLTQEEWKITIGSEDKILRVKKINIYQAKLGFSEIKNEYIIHRWIALNEENYKIFKNLDSLSEKVQLLEKILKAHILAFAEGVEFSVEQPIEISIGNIHKQKWEKFKKISLLAFDVSFSSNIILPNLIGLGKASSLGFGVIHMIKNKKEHKKNENLILKFKN